MTIRKENKVLYHAFDTFASPMLIALMAALESVGQVAGIPEKKLRAMAGPLLRQTLANYLEHGAAAVVQRAICARGRGGGRRHLDHCGSCRKARAHTPALASIGSHGACR